MLRELTITVDDTVYETLKPMIDQHTLSAFLHDFLQNRLQNTVPRTVPSITAMRGTLHDVDIADMREEADRPL